MTDEEVKGRPGGNWTAKSNRDKKNSYINVTGDESYFAWKIRLENTVNGDPEAPKAGLKLIRAYLEYASEANNPYRSMDDLVAETGLDERTIGRTRDRMVSLGYMVNAGRSSSGVDIYELRNPRAEFVLQHVEAKAKELREKKAAKKKSARSTGGKAENVPGKNVGDIHGAVPGKNAGDNSAPVHAGSCDVPGKNAGDVPGKNVGDVPLNFATQYRKYSGEYSETVTDILNHNKSLSRSAPDERGLFASDEGEDAIDDLKAASERGDDIEDDFEQFYRTYPKREGRKAALKAYRTARKSADASVILRAAARHAAKMDTERREPRFIKAPAAWLNGGHYLDEPAPASRPSKVLDADGYDASDTPDFSAMTMAEREAYAATLSGHDRIDFVFRTGRFA